jgi:hypothetical protein
MSLDERLLVISLNFSRVSTRECFRNRLPDRGAPSTYPCHTFPDDISFRTH